MIIIKDKQILTAIFLIIMTSFLSSQPQEILQMDEKTIKKLKTGKIIAHITQLPNSNTYRCQAMGIVYAPVEKVWDIITDYNHFKEFMPNISEAFIIRPDALSTLESNEVKDWKIFEKYLKKFKLEQIDNETVYFYNRFNLPWPLKDRYYILKMSLSPENHSFYWTLFIGNTKINDGSWELMPFSGSKRKTLAIYTLCTDPGISVSSALMHLALKTKLPGTVKALRKKILALFFEERKNARAQF